MVLPYFDYGDIIYQCTSTKHLNNYKLHKLQNRGLQICFGHRNVLSTDDMHIESNLTKLQIRRTQHVYKFMFKDRHQWWGREFRCSLSLNMVKLFPKAIINVLYH